LIGADAAGKDRDAVNSARQQAMAQFAGIKLPSVDDMTIALQNYQNTGILTPEAQQAIELGASNMEGISGDPRLRSQQMQALEQMSGIASGAPQAGDMAGFQLARQAAAGEAQAKQGQILQEMQQRGQAGSGAELLARLKSSQDSAQMLSNQDMQQAQAMQQARLAALQGQSNMASNVRTQDYGEAAKLAEAKDAIARYNAQNSQAVSGANVAARNQAQASNLQNAQNIANMNTETQNKQQIANKGLLQQNFGNQMNLAGAKAGQYGNQAAAATQQAANTAGMWSTIGQGAGSLAAGALTPKAQKAKVAAPDDEIV
jgi:hypothetical protein